MKPLSELRQDIVSGDWVLVSTGRANRPHNLASIEPASPEALSKCPFENPQASGNPEPILWSTKEHSNATDARERWFVQVIPNRYPAVAPHDKNTCSQIHTDGSYVTMGGVGYHEVIITRDHDRSLGLMNSEEVGLVIDSYRDRYLAIKNDACVAYILIFHNHGKEAGASLAHPHSQLIALPIIPPDVSRSYAGAGRFYKKYAACAHCHMLEEEQKARVRIVYENESFIVIAPFASHVTFELRIYPKRHQQHFETISRADSRFLADALTSTLGKLYRALGNPSYNFFIHTAPLISNGGDHYHWHLEILPKLSVPAGLELGAGVDVVVVAPEDVPQILSV